MASAWVSRPAKQRLEPPWICGSYTWPLLEQGQRPKLVTWAGEKRTRLLLRGESEEEERGRNQLGRWEGSTLSEDLGCCVC